MTEEQTRHLMELSMLNFTEAELNAFQKDFDDIEDFFKELNSVNVDGVEECIPKREFKDLRDDKILPSFDREQILKNAPRKDSISFIVPKVVE